MVFYDYNSALVIYHHPCNDGMAALWAAHKYFTDLGVPVKTHPATYGEPPPNVKDREVYILDFSYPKEVLLQMYETSRSLVVLDHHKTAKEDLADLDFCVFDMDRSGCGLTWDYFFPGLKRPWLIDYAEDRDLWNFKLPYSKEVNAVISSIQLDITSWDELSKMDLSHVIAEGKAIVRYIQKKVQEACDNAQIVTWEVEGLPTITLPIVNTSADTSDVLNKLAKESSSGIALGWWVNKDGNYIYSLRSVGEIDITPIAKHFGGGGHKNAAGFKLSYYIMPA